MTETTAAAPLVGRYELGEMLGRGGMATVYRARDRRLDRPVAIKLLDAHLADDPRIVERFRREARAAAALEHPHVVPVYDHGAHAGRPFIAMELVEGGTLRELVSARGALPEAEALQIASQIASALEAAHAAGIVHRDVTPRNVLLDQAGRAKVTDFGIALAADLPGVTSATSGVIGTATYMSPEQAQGQRVDARSDLYSLGVVLYELLTGAPPYQGESAIEVALRHVRESPVPPRARRPELSAAANALVLRAMARDPAARFPSATAMRQAIDRARDGLDPGSAVTTAPAGAAGAWAATQAGAATAAWSATPAGAATASWLAGSVGPAAEGWPTTSVRRRWPLWLLVGLGAILALAVAVALAAGVGGRGTGVAATPTRTIAPPIGAASNSPSAATARPSATSLPTATAEPTPLPSPTLAPSPTAPPPTVAPPPTTAPPPPPAAAPPAAPPPAAVAPPAAPPPAKHGKPPKDHRASGKQEKADKQDKQEKPGKHDKDD